MDFENQNYIDLVKACFDEETLFEDPVFPPTNDSIDPTGGDIPEGVEWMRPTEICDDPRFITDGISRFDISQGRLGDCWFLASVSTLTLREKVFERVVVKNNSDFASEQYRGIFVFKLWHDGKWVHIVVDDYLPTVEGQLIYCRSSQENEFWPALLEKAYAKLYGGYKAIDGGLCIEALIDFTGGIGESFQLEGMEEEDVFKILEKAHKKKSFLTASTPGSTDTEEKGKNLTFC